MDGRWERLSGRLAELEGADGTPSSASSALTHWLRALRFEASDPDQADTCWRDAIDLRPADCDLLVSYAEFLTDVRGDHAGAAGLFLRAVEANPDHPRNSFQWANALLVQGKTPQGLALLRQALRLVHRGDAPDTHLVARMMYALFAHDRAHSGQGLATLKTLLDAGIRAPGCNFELNVWAAQDDGHAEIGLLRDLAKVLSHGADVALLDSHVAWRLA